MSDFVMGMINRCFMWIRYNVPELIGHPPGDSSKFFYWSFFLERQEHSLRPFWPGFFSIKSPALDPKQNLIVFSETRPLSVDFSNNSEKTELKRDIGDREQKVMSNVGILLC